MEKIIELGKWLLEIGPELIAAFSGVSIALSALISALIGLFLLIPGEQPEKFLKEYVYDPLGKVLGLLEKISKKKSGE